MSYATEPEQSRRDLGTSRSPRAFRVPFSGAGRRGQDKGRSGQTRTRSRRTEDRLGAFVFGVLIIATLEAVVRLDLISDLILPTPSSVAVSLGEGLAIPDGLYWTHLWSTASTTIIAFAAATVVALAIASTMIVIPRVEGILLPFIVAFQSMPKIAIAPIILLWFGFGDMSRLVIAALVCFFPIVINILQGLRLRNRSEYELMQSLGASNWQTFRYIRLPNSLPFFFTGLHIGIIYSLLGVVVAEFVGGQEGMAFLMLNQRAVFNVPGTFSALTVLMVLGMVLHGLTKLLEHRVLFWSKETSDVAL